MNTLLDQWRAELTVPEGGCLRVYEARLRNCAWVVLGDNVTVKLFGAVVRATGSGAAGTRSRSRAWRSASFSRSRAICISTVRVSMPLGLSPHTRCRSSSRSTGRRRPCGVSI